MIVVLAGGQIAGYRVAGNVVQGEADLLEVVLRLGAGGREPRLGEGRQQQGEQDRQQRENEQQLKQGETARTVSFHARIVLRNGEINRTLFGREQLAAREASS